MIQIKSLLKSYGKVLGLLLMMVLGILFPQLSSLSFLIQYLLMAMLFFAFLEIEIRPRSFQRGVIWVVLANILVAFTAYWILRPFSLDLALTAFITGIAPTATAAPVIIGFLQGQVEYVVGAVLVTNVSMSLLLPLVLPFVVGNVVKVSSWQVLKPVLVTMFVPLILARLSHLLPKNAQSTIRRGKAFSFAFWLLALLISTSKASDFLRNDISATTTAVMPIALSSLVLCVIFPGGFIGRGSLPTGVQPVIGAEEQRLCDLGGVDFYQSAGRHGTDVLYPLSQHL
jgi:BASS family bile acid:Na+ symporter